MNLMFKPLYIWRWFIESHMKQRKEKKKRDLRVKERQIRKKRNETVRLQGEIRVESCIYSDPFFNP